MRVAKDLECTECKRKNYRTSRNKDGDKLRLNKFCPKCKTHTEHKEK